MRILLISKTTVIHRPKKLDWWLEAFGAHQLMVLQESYVERYAPDHVLRVPASEAAQVGIESVIQFGKLDPQTEDVAAKLRATKANFNVEK